MGKQLINEIMLKEGWGRIKYNPSSQHERLKAAAKYDRVKIDLDRGEEFFCSEKEVQAAGFTKAYGCE